MPIKVESEIRSPIHGGRHSADALVVLWTMRRWHGCICGSRCVHDYYMHWLPPAAARVAFDATARLAHSLRDDVRGVLRLQQPDFLWFTGHEIAIMRAFEAAREGGWAIALFETGQILRFEAVTPFVETLTRLGAALEDSSAPHPAGVERHRPAPHV